MGKVFILGFLLETHLSLGDCWVSHSDWRQIYLPHWVH